MTPAIHSRPIINMGKNTRNTKTGKWTPYSRHLYAEWRVYHKRFLWVFRELAQEVEKEAAKHKGPVSVKKIIEHMKDVPRHKIRRVRLQMNSNHVPFYAAFYRVWMEDKHPDLVKRIKSYQSRHDPEGQIREWLKRPKIAVTQKELNLFNPKITTERRPLIKSSALAQVDHY